MTSQKTLVIVRHGKSSWDYQEISDIDRPLKEQGIKNACEMAAALKKKGVFPEIYLSSPACRALHTAIIFMRILNSPENLFYVKNDLYLSDTEDIIQIISKTPGEINSLALFGHNPGFTDLVNYLSDLNIANLPTAGVAILHFNTPEWKNIGKSTYTLGTSLFPDKQKLL